MAVRDYIRNSVLKVSDVAQRMAVNVRNGKMSDLDGVLATMRAAEYAAGTNRHYFAGIIGNVLCDLSNWPPEMSDLAEWVAVPRAGAYFVPFQNGGYCLKLRDDPRTTEGNIPHHMLSYFVMATFYQGDVINVGVVVHEGDTYVKNRSNPSGIPDLRSGTMGSNLAQSMKFSLLNLFNQPVNGITDVYESKVRAGPCGHSGCR